MTVQEPSVRPSLIGTWFPTRYLYLRDGDSVRAWALTPVKQALGAVAAVLLGSWTVLASGTMIFDMVAQSQSDRTVASARAASERMNADLQARLRRHANQRPRDGRKLARRRETRLKCSA
jgi:hypothetical protein